MFIVNVEGAIRKDDRWIIIERSMTEEHAGGGLSLVGGKVEAENTPNILEKTLKREIAEEIGITIKDEMKYICDYYDFDTTLAEDVMLLTPFAADADDEATKNFVAAYNEAYGETPIQFAADAYDAMYIIKAALEKAGATPEMSASELCEVMKAAMLEITVDGLTGAGMTWTEDGEVNKEPKAVKIVDGAYTAM